MEIEMILVEGNDKINTFYIGKYPVTQAQWKEVMENNPSYFSGFSGCDQCPVETVSWNDAVAFIAKLNDGGKNDYRLPTKAEWEYAAQGGKKSQGFKYAGSNNLDEVGWYNENAGSKTHPVGTKAPNELGIYDMSGNVWEWCEDEIGTDRVFRGGSWSNSAVRCRAAFRNGWLPQGRFSDLGFRLALSIPPH